MQNPQNWNLKINESQSQQNSSHLLGNNPSILEENKSLGHSFKFENSNFDISKFTKFDSTNNISRIKVPYFDGNNQDNNNFTLTNASNMNELSLHQNNRGYKMLWYRFFDWKVKQMHQNFFRMLFEIKHYILQ